MQNQSGIYASGPTNHLVIEREVYAWLTSEEILSNKIRFPEVSGKKIELDDHSTRRFESGQAVQKLLEGSFPTLVADFFQRTPLMLARAQTGSTRAYNWKVLAQCLRECLRISIDESVISRIIAGDIQFVAEILKDLYSKKNEKQRMNSPFESMSSIVDLSDIQSALEGRSLLSSNLTSNRRISMLDEGLIKKKLYKREKALKALAKSQLEPVNLEKLSAASSQDLSKVFHGLEFVILSIANSFQIDPKTAASLIGNHNKTWGRVVIKGYQNSFEPLMAWYSEILRFSRKVIDLCLYDKSEENMYNILCLLKPGILSKDFDLSALACKVVSKIASELTDHGKAEALFEWVRMPGYGLGDAWAKALQRHPENTEGLIKLLRGVCGTKENFEVFFIEEMLSFRESENEEDYFRMLHLVFPSIAANPNTQWLFEKEENRLWLLEKIFKVLRVQWNRTKPRTILKSIVIKLLVDLAQTYPEEILENDEIRKEMLSNIKGCFGMSANAPNVFLLEVSSQCFVLLDFLRSKGYGAYQEAAHSLYHFLAFLMTKSATASVRQFILSLFLGHLRDFPLRSPVFLFEYYARVMATLEGIAFNVTLLDIEFLILLAEMEAKNNIKNTVPMLEVLLRIYFKNVFFSTIVIQKIAPIISAHQKDPVMMEYITDLVKKGLGFYYNSERKRRPYDKEDIYKHLKENLLDQDNSPFGFTKPTELLKIEKEKEEEEALQKRKPKRNVLQGSLGSSKSVRTIKTRSVTRPKYSEHELQVERIQRHKRGLIVEFVKMLLEIRNRKVNSFVRDFILYTNLLLKKAQLENPDVVEAQNSPAMMILLGVFGNPQRLIQDHEDDAEFRVLKGDNVNWNDGLSLLESGSTPSLSMIERSISKPASNRIKNTMLNSLILSKVESVSLVIGKDKMYKRARKKGVEADPRITRKLKELRENFLQSEETIKTRAIEEEKRTMEQREVLKKMIELRNIELGVPTRGDDLEKAIVQKFGTIPDYENEKRKALNGLVYRVFDIEGEEDTVAKALKVLLDNFRPAVKHVFEKLSKQSIKQVSDNFAQMQHDSLFIHRKQILQFVNDHNLDAFITRNQLYSLVRDVKVTIMGDQIDVMTLDYEGFVQLLLNLACFIFSQPKFGMGHLPPSYLLYMFIEHLKKVWASEGYSTLIFTEPEAIDYIDPDVILYINKKLRKNKRFPIPKMLEKYTEKTLQFYYGMPSILRLPPGYKEAYDMLDDIIFNIWQFHILPLRHKFNETIKVRPKPINPIEHRKVVELHTSRFLEEEEEAREAAQARLDEKLGKGRIVDHKNIDLEVLVRGLPIKTRIRLANFELDKRGVAIETAICLEKIFSAVVFSSIHPDEPKPKLNLANVFVISSKENKATRKRAQRESKAEQERQELNKRIEARMEELEGIRSEINEYKNSKKTKKIEDEKEQKRQLRALDKSRLENLKKYWDPKIEKHQKNKEKKEEEKEKEEKAKKEKEKEIKSEKKENFEEFLEKEMEMNIEKGKKIREKLEKARFRPPVRWHLKHEEDDLIKMRISIDKDKRRLEKSKEFNQRLISFYRSPPIQATLKPYRPLLRMLFDHYVRQQHVVIGLPRNTEELLMEGLTKMGSQIGFTPFIVSPQRFGHLYRNIVRFKETKENGADPGLSFEDFVLLVLRIVVEHRSYFEKVSLNYKKALEANKKQELEADETKEEKEAAEKERIAAEKEALNEMGTDEDAESKKEEKMSQEFSMTSKESIDGLFYLLRLPKTTQEMKTKLTKSLVGNAKLIPNRLRKMIFNFKLEDPTKMVKNHLSIIEMA